MSSVVFPGFDQNKRYKYSVIKKDNYRSKRFDVVGCATLDQFLAKYVASDTKTVILYEYEGDNNHTQTYQFEGTWTCTQKSISNDDFQLNKDFYYQIKPVSDPEIAVALSMANQPMMHGWECSDLISHYFAQQHSNPIGTMFEISWIDLRDVSRIYTGVYELRSLGRLLWQSGDMHTID